MTERTGLGVLEVAALRAIEAAGGGAEPVQSLQVLEDLERDGFGRAYMYLVLQDLVVPWQVQLPLVEGQGNFGSPGNDPAAEPQYTEVGLSRLGRLALAAEEGRSGPLPIRLIEGNAYCGGSVPPFAPRAVVRALDRLLDLGDAIPDTELDELVGPPALPTGGVVHGDIAALLRGEPTPVEMSCRIEHGAIGEARTLEIVGFPLRGNPDEILDGIATRIPHAGSRRGGGQEFASNVQDHSSGRHGTRIVVALREGVDIQAAEAWLRSVWPVTVEVDWRLPAPMPDRLRTAAAAIRPDPSAYAELRSSL